MLEEKFKSPIVFLERFAVLEKNQNYLRVNKKDTVVQPHTKRNIWFIFEVIWKVH